MNTSAAANQNEEEAFLLNSGGRVGIKVPCCRGSTAIVSCGCRCLLSLLPRLHVFRRSRFARGHSHARNGMGWAG